MSEEMANIYQSKVRVGWRKKRGNGYFNVYRGTDSDPVTIVSRSGTADEMNKNPMLISQLMTTCGATGKSNYDFHVVEVFESVDLGKSFFYKKDEQ